MEPLAEVLKQVSGYIYPNEVELHWGILIVLYPYLTGLVAGAFILASLVRVFNVKVLAVNVMNVHGKQRRWGRRSTRRPSWKKAIVTLDPGDKIELFEGV
jgi:hypothetical protein